MNAYFSRAKTRRVKEYMNRMQGRENDMSFANSRINGTITINDHTRIYIQKYPGHIKIKLDKDENSWESYENVREMYEGIREILIGEER